MRALARLTVVAPLAVALALGGAAGTTTAGTPAPWASLHRALRLEPLAAGARCPVSPLHALDRGRLSGAGVGPVYPLPSPFGPDGRHAGWIGSKTLWAWPAALRTKHVRVLVRGRRLDSPGALRFQLGPDWDTTPLMRELRLDTTQTVGAFGNSTWGTTVTMLFARAPGCYGLQLDSEQGTSIVVVRA